MRRRADPEPIDNARLWRQAMRDVAPLRARPRAVEPGVPPMPPPKPPERIVSPAAAPAAAPAPPPLDRLAGIDRANAERLKRGQRAIEARLDLHGMTQREAHRALAAFIAGSRAAGRRCLLVITGRGRSSGGVLREAVPRWLDQGELRRHLLAIAPAQPRHGGSGALYVLLRRPAQQGS